MEVPHDVPDPRRRCESFSRARRLQGRASVACPTVTLGPALGRVPRSPPLTRDASATLGGDGGGPRGRERLRRVRSRRLIPMIEDPFGWVGHTLGEKLKVEAVVAEGGFGVVYRALHLGFSERVALKCLKLPAKLEDAARDEFLAAFTAEGKLLHRLSRSNAGIVQALDVGAATSPNGTWTPYLALEWLEGESLEDDMTRRLREGAPRRESRRDHRAPRHRSTRARGRTRARHRAPGHQAGEPLSHRDRRSPHHQGGRLRHRQGHERRRHDHRCPRRHWAWAQRVHASVRRAGAVRSTLRRDRSVDRRLRARARPRRAARRTVCARWWRHDAALHRVKQDGAPADAAGTRCRRERGGRGGVRASALRRIPPSAADRRRVLERPRRRGLRQGRRDRRTPRTRRDRARPDRARSAARAVSVRAASSTGTGPDDHDADRDSRSRAGSSPAVAIAPSSPPARRDGSSTALASAPAPSERRSRATALAPWLGVLTLLAIGGGYAAWRATTASGKVSPTPSTAVPVSAPPPSEVLALAPPSTVPVASASSPVPLATEPLSELAPADVDLVERHGGWDWGNRCYRHIKAGQLAWAKAACDRGLAMGPRSPDPRASILYNLGVIEERRGNVRAARAYFKESVDLRPERDGRGRTARPRRAMTTTRAPPPLGELGFGRCS